MEKILLQSLPGIITALIAAYAVARWSLWKIYAEKWWERKEKAYSEIIESLYNIIQYYEFKRDYHLWERKLSDENEKKILERFIDGYGKLTKATVIGGFVISEDAATLLDTLRNIPKLKWQDNAPWEVYENDYDNHKETLDKLIIIANEDLKAPKALNLMQKYWRKLKQHLFSRFKVPN